MTSAGVKTSGSPLAGKDAWVFPDTKTMSKQSAPSPFEKLFSGLIWPAVGGNVAWAFLTVLLEPKHQNYWGFRLAMLAVVAFYVCFAWARAEEKDRTLLYRISDGVLAIGIGTFAIAVQLSSTHDSNTAFWMKASLVGVLAILGCGHLICVWREYRSSYLHLALFGANMWGIGASLRYAHVQESSMSWLFIAVICSFLAWCAVQWIERSKVKLPP